MPRLVLSVIVALALGVVVGLSACDEYTWSEQVADANRVCATHGGIQTFDSKDDSGSGEGPANGICRDGYLFNLDAR